MMTAWKKGLRMRLVVSCLCAATARRVWGRGRGRPRGDCRILRYLRFGAGLSGPYPFVSWRSTARIIHRPVNAKLTFGLQRRRICNLHPLFDAIYSWTPRRPSFTYGSCTSRADVNLRNAPAGIARDYDVSEILGGTLMPCGSLTVILSPLPEFFRNGRLAPVTTESALWGIGGLVRREVWAMSPGAKTTSTMKWNRPCGGADRL